MCGLSQRQKKNLNVLLSAVESLKAAGGGAYLEASVEALTLAIEHLKDGSVNSVHYRCLSLC